MQLNKVELKDCREFIKSVPNNFVNLIVIDPPYNELPKDWDNFHDWNFLKNEFDRVLKRDGQLYIFGKQPMLSELYYKIMDKFEFRFELVWNKGKGFWTSNYLPMRSHELVWCFKKKKVKTSELFFDIEVIKTPGKPFQNQDGQEVVGLMKGVCVLVFALAFVFVIPSVLSEDSQNVSLEIRGACREYNVTVSLEGFEEGCYDIKVDVTTAAGRVGRIFDPREGWKSSFFYVREDFCVENRTGNGSSNVSKTYMVRAETSSGVLNFRGTVRYGSKTWDTGFYEIVQDCPGVFAEEPGLEFWLVVLVVVMVILAGIVVHKKLTLG